ncbi:DNA helicase II [compost metagenome]
MIGANWQYELLIDAARFDKLTLQMLSDHRLIDYQGHVFKLNEELNQICSFLQLQLGDGERFRELVIQAYNSIISAKKELDQSEYLQMNNSYSVFNKDEKDKILTIFKSFKQYVETIGLQGFYEEGEIVRLALKQSSPRYDYLVIDEIQDFTEVQVYYLCQLLKKKNNVMVCGDFHQTVHPTFFSAGRIESIFKFLGGMDQFTKHTLENNYRSGKEIVDFANSIASFRNEYVPGKLDYDYRESPKREETRKPYLFRGRKEQLLSSVKDKSYILIVVPDEQTKSQLIQDIPGLDSRIVTVTEIKGIERKYIITYNLISAYKDQWRTILARTSKNSEAHRYYFNMLYVGITRARDVLGMLEDDLSDEIFQKISSYMELIDDFDVRRLELSENSTLEQMYVEAIDFEKSGIYPNAIAIYEGLQQKGSEFYKRLAHIGVQRCRINEQYLLDKDHAACGVKLFQIEEYEQAIEPLYKAKDASTLLQAILLTNGHDRYDVYAMMQECGTNPLSVLMDLNNTVLLTRYLNYEVQGFQKSMNNLVQSSNEVQPLFARKR